LFQIHEYLIISFGRSNLIGHMFHLQLKTYPPCIPTWLVTTIQLLIPPSKPDAGFFPSHIPRRGLWFLKNA